MFVSFMVGIFNCISIARPVTMNKLSIQSGVPKIIVMPEWKKLKLATFLCEKIS